MFDKIKFISNENVKGKTIILRVDLNSNVTNDAIPKKPRILEHAKTIRLLCEKGAKLVILSHQGRKGQKDFVSLKSHYNTLKELSFGSVENLFFSTWEEDYKSKIKELEEGDALLRKHSFFRF